MWNDNNSEGCVYDTVDCTQCGGCGRYNNESDISEKVMEFEKDIHYDIGGFIQKCSDKFDITYEKTLEHIEYNVNERLGKNIEFKELSCVHRYIKIETRHTQNNRITVVEDLFCCEKCLDYQKRIRP